MTSEKKNGNWKMKCANVIKRREKELKEAEEKKKNGGEMNKWIYNWKHINDLKDNQE